MRRRAIKRAEHEHGALEIRCPRLLLAKKYTEVD